MDKLSDKAVCIVDNGLFVGFADVLAETFGKVYYCTPTAGPFPTSSEYGIGRGLDGVERLADPNDALARIDKIDLFVFPDLYFAGMQVMLRQLGKRVWGSGPAEILELDRLRCKRFCEKSGLEVGKYTVVKGVSEAEAFVKSHPGVFLKTSRHAPPARGDFETLKCSSYRDVRFRLEEIRTRLGPLAETVELILETPIPDALELATDVYSVHGEWPAHGVLGIEAKAESYLGKVVPYDTYPDGLQKVNDAFSVPLEKSSYSNNCAIECRLTKDGHTYVLDPCLRFGRPPLCLQVLITNWAEIMWGGGAGELVEPEWSGKWAAEQMLYCDYAENHPAPVHIDPKFEKNLRLSNFCRIKGESIVIPQNPGISGIGSVVAVGNTAQQAIDRVREASKTVEGYDVKASDALDSCLKQVKEASDFKVNTFQM